MPNVEDLVEASGVFAPVQTALDEPEAQASKEATVASVEEASSGDTQSQAEEAADVNVVGDVAAETDTMPNSTLVAEFMSGVDTMDVDAAGKGEAQESEAEKSDDKLETSEEVDLIDGDGDDDAKMENGDVSLFKTDLSSSVNVTSDDDDVICDDVLLNDSSFSPRRPKRKSNDSDSDVMSAGSSPKRSRNITSDVIDIIDSDDDVATSGKQNTSSKFL